MDKPLRCLLLADFNPGNLAGLLANDEAAPTVEPLCADYGQLAPVLAQADHPLWRAQPDLALLWSLPEKAVPSFQRLLAGDPVTLAELLAEVDAFAAAVLQAAPRARSMLLCNWVLDPARRGLGLADLRPGGLAHALQEMNTRLARNIATANSVYLLDAGRWMARIGPTAFAPKLWYQAKVPFANPVFVEAVADVKAALRCLRGQSRKLIVLDLDDTLWGGVLGDVGWENLRLGGHDPSGEAFVDFQRALKALTRRGIVLGIVSKNDEAAALTALRSHPEMVLREADFAGRKINWRDKAANLIELAAELNLGLQSLVFIDDNPVERARVREALPEVLVPDWPENPQLYPSALAQLRCFDTLGITAEDATRAAAYAAEHQRSELKAAVSFDDWLCSLGTVVEVAPLTAANLARAAQLLNKTNQMNLRTRRLTEAELKRWAEQPGNYFWVFRVTDKFGDSGLTGLASLELHGSTASVTDFVLSCRVMGRRLEETMVAWLVQNAARLNPSPPTQIFAEYATTGKNQPCLEFWQRSGFATTDRVTFAWDLTANYPVPAGINLVTA